MDDFLGEAPGRSDGAGANEEGPATGDDVCAIALPFAFGELAWDRGEAGRGIAVAGGVAKGEGELEADGGDGVCLTGDVGAVETGDRASTGGGKGFSTGLAIGAFSI